MSKRRVIVIEDIINQRDKIALQEHGELVSLSDQCSRPKPLVWQSRTFSAWLEASLHDIKYNPTTDSIALAGNYLSLVQLIAVVAVIEEPYSIPVLSFSRGDNGAARFLPTIIEEGRT